MHGADFKHFEIFKEKTRLIQTVKIDYRKIYQRLIKEIKMRTTEQISAEICKVCGIPAIELTGCSFVNLREYGIEEGTDVCEHMEEPGFNCANCECNKKAADLYPDFGTASNFLKLYNMQMNGVALCYLVHSNFQTESSKQFLQNLLKILNGKAAFCKAAKNAIKNGRWLI